MTSPSVAKEQPGDAKSSVKGSDLPDQLPGHWNSADGHEMAERYLAMRSRAKLTKSDLTDFELANAIYMADRNDLDLIVYQTAAKERIRWLSAQLAKALREPPRDPPALGDKSREAI